MVLVFINALQILRDKKILFLKKSKKRSSFKLRNKCWCLLCPSRLFFAFAADAELLSLHQETSFKLVLK
jgi:hypothetical protein